MPVFHYKCDNCGEKVRRILTPEQSKKDQLCPKCEVLMDRDMKPPSARVVEVLDNGIMAKSLERLSDAERLYAERRKTEKSEP